jgi:DNA-binding transcriptional LysR family regulator
MLTATLIGDVVASRTAEDRAGLHARLSAHLDDVNATCAPTTPLRITIGDEFQGTFATVGQALHASVRLRVALLPDHDVRHGIGWGEVAVLQEQPRVEDGPGWWAARDAIHDVQEAQRHPGSRFRRTVYRRAPREERDSGPDAGPDPVLVDAVLVLRDAAVGALSERSMSVLRGLLRGQTQREIADELGISPSAVSQRVRADSLAALVHADRELGRV